MLRWALETEQGSQLRIHRSRRNLANVSLMMLSWLHSGGRALFVGLKAVPN